MLAVMSPIFDQYFGIFSNPPAQEMPEVPDVRILHCGEMLHHKMGIKVRTTLAFHSFMVCLW